MITLYMQAREIIGYRMR